MELRILGPLELVVDEAPVELRGARRRSLVAYLAVNVGQFRSLDRIVEDLWGPDPPSGAGRTVQTYVSQLRGLLASDGVSIVGRDGGYVFDAPDAVVDAWHFEHLLREAAGHDPHDVVRHLDDALALWRGSPLEEFDGEWARDERTRLQLLHLQATDLLLDARLATEPPGALLAELEALVARQPLDERFWAKLLLAYHRSGRTADALRAFQRAREVLTTEIGIEPGPLLVDLERRILAGDEALAAPLASAGPPPRRALPSGTVTFLFTDLADSTRLWEEDQPQMAAADADCRSSMVAAVHAHDGEVVKSTGDGIMAVFRDADRAIDAAVACQRTFLDDPWPVRLRVRIGLHTGTADADDGDYHGPTANRAARVMATAHPDQILVSETTAALAERSAFRDLGLHRLRGLAPMRLHQVLADGLPRDFPLTATTELVGLPTPTTSFIGRDEQLDRVADLIDAHPLVTLTGTGGCGKTRLAVEVARRSANDFDDGVRFVDLAATTDDAAFEDAVVDALGLTASPDATDARSRVCAYLGERQMLVVLDNCEHLLDASAALAESVLARPTGSRLLATSREPLGVLGEQVVRLPSLDVDSEAVELFTQRADAARPATTTGEEARQAVHRICRRLDGIPLAIELAAAQVRHLSPVQILERLDERFLLLTGGSRRIQRQQTLAATLDWSHDLLTDEERVVLRRLATFPAAFTLEAAEAVVDSDDVLEHLASLTAKSLVQVVDAEDGLRYRLLETVRLYAEAKLVDAGEAAEGRSRHRDWVDTWLDEIPIAERWLGDRDLLATELPSVRTAIDWSLSTDDLTAAARLVTAVDWSRTESWADAVGWCRRLDRVPLPTELRIRVLAVRWWLAPLSPIRTVADDLLAASSERPGPLHALAHAAFARDHIVPAVEHGDVALRQRVIDATETAVTLSEGGDVAWRLYCRLIAAMTYCSFRDPQRAAEHLEDLVSAPAPVPYHDLHAALQGYRAIAALVLDDAGTALRLARAAYSPDSLVPYWQHARATSLVALAAQGDHDTARQALLDYRATSRTVDWVYATESVFILGGVLAGMREDWPTAAVLLSAGHRGVRRTPSDYLLYATYRDRTRAALGPDRARRCRDEGRLIPTEQALELAVAR